MSDLAAQLRAKLSAPQETKTQEPQDTYGEVAQLIATITGGDVPERDERLEDIGVTSLNRIEFAVRAEQRFGTKLAEAPAASWETVGDVAAYIDTHAVKP